MGPTFNKKKNIKTLQRRNGRAEFVFFLFFFYFFSLTSLFDLRKSDRQNSSGQEAKCSTQ